MTRFHLLILTLLCVSCQAEKSPEEILLLAKEKFFAAENVSFSQTMYWENPNLGEVDTFEYKLVFQKHQNKFFDYNYVGTRKGYDLSYINDVLASVDHEDSTVTYHSEEDTIMFKELASNNMFLPFSPIHLLKKEPWQFKKDTVVGQKKLLNFFRVERDTAINEIKVLTENHIFVNPANLFVELLSWRFYHDGNRKQLIEVHFSDYLLDAKEINVEANIPLGYLSKISDEKKTQSSKLLAVGDLAPDFELADLDGNTIRLSDFRGKKVLLDFSMINCGWCRIALEDFNKPDFQFANNIVPLYVNPVDTREKMQKYVSRVQVPFPVLIDAKSVGESFGVSGYPTFFLVDEFGKIEAVEVGYSDGFSSKFRKGE
jgi:peroxiredoxin